MGTGGRKEAGNKTKQMTTAKTIMHFVHDYLTDKKG